MGSSTRELQDIRITLTSPEERGSGQALLVQSTPPPYSLMTTGRSNSCAVLKHRQQQQQQQQQPQEQQQLELCRRSSENSATNRDVLRHHLQPLTQQHHHGGSQQDSRRSSVRRESRQSGSQSSERLLVVPAGSRGRQSIVSLMSSSGYRISLDRLPDDLASQLERQQLATGCGGGETQHERRLRRRAEEAELPTGSQLLDRLRSRYRLRLLELVARPFLKRAEAPQSGGQRTQGSHGERYRPPPLALLAQRTRFSREEVKALYRSFKQQCPSGLLRRRQFVEAMAYLFPMGNPSLFSHYVFGALDADSDGLVTTEDLVCALSMLTRGEPDDRLRWVFRLYDVDSDGLISRQDALAMSAAIFDLCGEQVHPPVCPDTPAMKLEQLFADVNPADPEVITEAEFMRCMEKKFGALPAELFATPLF